MKRKINQGILAILSVAMLLATFSGCTEKATKTNSNNIAEIRIWSGASHSKSVYNKLVDNYNRTIGQEKKIKIIYEVKEGNLTQNVELALQSNQAPEMFGGSSLAKLAESNYIVALEDLPGGDKLIEKYSKYIRDFYNRYQGKTYSIPLNATTRGLIYNKDMFKAAGIVNEKGEPKPPETLGELREYAKRLTNHDKKQYGIIFPLKWDGWFGSDIGEVTMPSVGFNGYNPVAGTYDYSGYKPVMEAILGIKEDQSYMPGAEGIDNDHARARFAEGNIGMKFGYSFDVGVLNDQFPAKCDWGVAPLPVVDKNKKFRQAYDISSFCYINKNAVETIGAEKLMEVYNWLHSDEVAIELYKEGMAAPCDWNLVKDIPLNDEKKGWVDFCKMTEISILDPVPIKIDVTGKIIIKQHFVNNVWVGKMTVEEAIKIQNEVANDGMKQYADLHPEYDRTKYIIKDWDPSR